ncbi:stage III sporulation protein AG [Evansella sp. AB-rgal1]|uniref:stage III sporulation protein AG n=1 Tax=Evansella sp. AB-rgal1 TaxID=3242696 RepID=UPI00359D2B16
MDENKQESNLFKSISLRGPGKKMNIKYVFVLLAAGVLFMVVGTFMQSENEPSSIPVLKEEEEDNGTASEEVFMSSDKPEELATMTDYETFYESQLEKALEQVAGVSEVTVIVNLAETENVVYQKNISTKEQTTNETDREGGTREVQDKTNDEQVVITRSGDKEEALIQRTEKPTIRGVLVVANGAENIQVKSWIVEAVSRTLDVPTHRVSVLPKKSKGE